MAHRRACKWMAWLMEMSMPKAKKKSTTALPLVLHIYCEGEKTEPGYLREYLEMNYFGEHRYHVVKIESTKKNTPIQLVDVAVAAKKSAKCPSGDEFWVVYDRESTAKYSDELHANASAKARANGVHIALSNVCFELWILLHFKSNTAAFGSFDDLMANSGLKKELRKIGVNDYDKGNAAIFEKIRAFIGDARARAEAMNQNTLGSAPPRKNQPYQLNPFTAMHELLDAIDAFK